MSDDERTLSTTLRGWLMGRHPWQRLLGSSWAEASAVLALWGDNWLWQRWSP